VLENIQSSGVAVLIAWLYFSRLDNQEALDKIKRKLSAGHKKLHWIKTADSKGNVFLLNVKEIEYFQAQQKYTCVYSKGREYFAGFFVNEQMNIYIFLNKCR
jgi:DNA-binding LytR/AlgR family response regulator